MTELGKNTPLYLKPDTRLEPLVARWYAWSHLISPVQAALNLVYRQLPILRSFLANPGANRDAGNDADLFTGSFALLDESAAPSVTAWIERVMRDHADAVRLAMELKSFEKKFLAQANGLHLDTSYQMLPRSLVGALELGYDAAGRPTLRVYEEMIAGTKVDLVSAQQISVFSGHDEDRAFFLNTPRLECDDRFDISIPFADPRLSRLLGMRTFPATLAQLAEDLALDDDRLSTLAEYLTPETPVRNAPEVTGDGLRVRSFGHACLLVQTADCSVLFDPLVAQEAYSADARLTMADLPDHIDYVFITHNHQDHFNPETLLQLRGRIGRIFVARHNACNLADPSMSLALKGLGFDNVTVLEPLAEVALPGGRLVSLPFYGEHADLDIQSKHGCYLQLGGKTLAVLADSNCLDPQLYARFVERYGPADAMFIGMECEGAPLSWLYGPYLAAAPSFKSDESRRLSGSNAERAWRVAEALGARQAFVYAMGQEAWLRQHLGLEYSSDSVQILEADRFIERCQAAGTPARRIKGCQDIAIGLRDRADVDDVPARDAVIA